MRPQRRRQELAAPLRPVRDRRASLVFRGAASPEASQNGATSSDPARYERLRKGFGAPRYTVLYRTWTHVGDRALSALGSRVLADALDRKTGRIEWQSLPRPYLHLSPLVGTA